MSHCHRLFRRTHWWCYCGITNALWVVVPYWMLFLMHKWLSYLAFLRINIFFSTIQSIFLKVAEYCVSSALALRVLCWKIHSGGSLGKNRANDVCIYLSKHFGTWTPNVWSDRGRRGTTRRAATAHCGQNRHSSATRHVRLIIWPAFAQP